MRLLLSLLLTQLEAMSFFMALFYVLSRALAFQTRPGQHGLRTFLIRYVFFTGITITGSYLGIQLPGGVIANTRAVGAIATTMEGFIGGLVQRELERRGGPGHFPDWRLAGGITACTEVLHMGWVVTVSRPLDDAIASAQVIGPPMILANAVGAVAITDTTHVLAFDGLGADHHRAGGPIVSVFSQRAIEHGEMVFADGVHEHFACPLVADCPLDAVLEAPLEVDGSVLGTVQLYEPRHQRFRSVNRSLGEGLASLLSARLLQARYEKAKVLLTVQELKLVQAQVNPHFLFNSLNTIAAVLRTDASRARELLLHLAAFFRKNLKRPAEFATLREELEHANAYLEIEEARFADRLTVETEVDQALLALRLPAFTLQPLVENAFKHGLSQVLGPGTARIRARRDGALALLKIEDSAGACSRSGPASSASTSSTWSTWTRSSRSSSATTRARRCGPAPARPFR